MLQRQSSRAGIGDYVNQGIQHGAEQLQQRAPGMINRGRSMINQQTGFKRGGNVDREEHNWGSFVRGAKKTFGGVGKALNNAGKAIAPYAKQAIGQAARGAGQAAVTGAMMAKKGGRIDRQDHMGHRGQNR